MANFISEDEIEQALLQRLQHQLGYDVLNCHTTDPEDINDGSNRENPRQRQHPPSERARRKQQRRRSNGQLRKHSRAGDELKVIAAELVTQVRKSVTIDWTLRESARAKIKVLVKRILRKHGYPPDLEEEATKTVLAQAELLCADWAV